MALHARPPCAAALATTKERVALFPSPHEAEHSVHCIHDPSQSTGQGEGSHGLEVVVALSWNVQAAPPAAASTDTLKERSRVPPPQVCEHDPHWPHAPTQSTGQGSVAQARTTSVSLCPAPQEAPPFRAGTTTSNVRLWEPLLLPSKQDVLQSLQALQFPSQSRGHVCGWLPKAKVALGANSSTL